MIESQQNDILSGGGKMGELIRSFDWSTTPLGPRENWPQSLLTTISIILNSQQPMWVGWGPENTFLYNDPYIDVLSLAKHPWALGRPTPEIWSEIWDVCGPLSDKVFLHGEASFLSDVQLIMSRGDFLEETYYSFSYSPIREESGRVGGLFCPSNETTIKVLNTRRLATISELAARTLLEKTVPAVCAGAARALAENHADIPFALLYLLSDDDAHARLVETIGLSPGSAFDDPIWPLQQAIDGLKSIRVPLANLREPAHGLLDQPVQEAMILPVISAGQQRPAGLLVVGINPCRKLDQEYETFLNLLAGQIATSLQSAKSYEELAELDRAKTAFFSNVSHEFRTPLTLMLGPLEQLLADNDGVRGATRIEIEVAHRNSLRLLKLVNTLLDFSRIEAGRVEASFEDIDLCALTSDLASVFRSTIERAGLEYRIECHALEGQTFVDQDMWEKIVLNLISNAFKFTMSGHITVRLSETADAAILEIIDSGIGIPSEALPNIFKRFHRVDGAHGRSHEGSGIGLALVQELVKLHGGTVVAESSYGRGALFRVTLPKGQHHLPGDQLFCRRKPVTPNRVEAFVEEANRWLNMPSMTVENQDALRLTSTARVLLVDDNADMRRYMQKLLSPHWQVITASNGAEALDIARRELPDLVLTDVMMPILNGFELLRALRSNPETQLIPIILLSARAGEESRIEGMEAGADDYLVKPFAARELIARVGANLEMARIRRQAAEREQVLRQEAEEAHAQTLAVLESIGDGFMALDPSWTITYANAHAEKINGLARSELLGKNHWEIFPDSTNLREIYQKALDEHKPVKLENHYAPMDRWFEVDVYPTRHQGLSIFFRDITERKRQMLSQEIAKQELESIFKYAPVGMAVMEGRDYTFSLANDEYLKLWGGSQALIGRTVLEMVPDAEEQGFLPLLDRVYETGQPEAVREMDLSIEQSNGTVQQFVVAFVYAPKFDMLGQVNGIVVIVTDITARKKAEQEREQLLLHLKEVDRRKDEFLAVLSHELRSPLNVIGGHAELLRYEEPGTAEFMESLDAIERNTKAQTQLISDLLDISRIVTGKFLLDVSTFELIPVLNAAVDAVRFAAESKGVLIERRIEANVRFLVGDATRIQQMIWNLLANAVKFTPGGGCVTLAARMVDGSMSLEVSDTGQGISQDFLPHVFDRFHQEDASNTRKFGGLGLGLSIVRHIAELHGGTVEASSRGKNRGATFTVSLPIRLLAPPDIQDDTERSPVTRVLRDLTILIIDDQQDAREMLSMAFHHLGASNNLAPSGSDALELLTIKKFDVIVCDVGMPEMNGLQFIQRWRQMEMERGQGFTPAIALTAYASAQDRQNALAAGFQSHLAKPVKISELSEVIADICR